MMPTAALRIAVLASGRGSNLAAVLAASASGRLPVHVVGVFSDRRDCGALLIADQHQVPAHALNPRQFASRGDFDTALFAAIDQVEPGLIVCAGFMRILSAAVVGPRSQTLINIHPALLPKYTGLHTHARALAAGDAEHGASVHFMIPKLDAGPVIAQTRIAILADDNADTLAARLLPHEHELLIQSIALFTQHRVGHQHGRVVIDGGVLEVPLRF
jgi:phosphoribosylglycinamide formyltransferase-1